MQAADGPVPGKAGSIYGLCIYAGTEQQIIFNILNKAFGKMKEEQVYFLIDLCNKYDCLAAFKAGFDNNYSQFGKMFSPTGKYIEIASYGPISIHTDLEAIMIDPVVKIEYGKYGKPKLTDNTADITGNLNAAKIPYTQTGRFILIHFG